MTRYEAIVRFVDDQIRNGHVKPENRAKHIALRAKGSYPFGYLSKAQYEALIEPVEHGSVE